MWVAVPGWVARASRTKDSAKAQMRAHFFAQSDSSRVQLPSCTPRNRPCCAMCTSAAPAFASRGQHRSSLHHDANHRVLISQAAGFVRRPPGLHFRKIAAHACAVMSPIQPDSERHPAFSAYHTSSPLASNDINIITIIIIPEDVYDISVENSTTHECRNSI